VAKQTPKRPTSKAKSTAAKKPVKVTPAPAKSQPPKVVAKPVKAAAITSAAATKNAKRPSAIAPPVKSQVVAKPQAATKVAKPAKPPVVLKPIAPVKPPEPAYVPPPVEQVLTGDSTKPKKNQAGLSSKELETFRNLLLDKRRELVGDMYDMEREALGAGGSNLSTLPVHMADMGTDNYEQEFTLGLVEKDRSLLREINHALAKIQNGTFGLCEGTGKPISKVRLEAQPWTRFSIEHAREMEKRRGGIMAR